MALDLADAVAAAGEDADRARIAALASGKYGGGSGADEGGGGTTTRRGASRDVAHALAVSKTAAAVLERLRGENSALERTTPEALAHELRELHHLEAAVGSGAAGVASLTDKIGDSLSVLARGTDALRGAVADAEAAGKLPPKCAAWAGNAEGQVDLDTVLGAWRGPEGAPVEGGEGPTAAEMVMAVGPAGIVEVGGAVPLLGLAVGQRVQ